ncbi:hypothetical protein IF1G_03647 [Cordyceps javanica]|uniref:Uncharacterized protein n=1 Tax=Cordyceps javanica TaxID=43265 RepID=A0A545V850_9HYPO|nr:hypothetical protein IF1G_03647 [Cordyceps javanica]TQW08914.1 sicP binding domain-containing protein [Cordyceps javanica]
MQLLNLPRQKRSRLLACLTRMPIFKHVKENVSESRTQLCFISSLAARQGCQPENALIYQQARANAGNPEARSTIHRTLF